MPNAGRSALGSKSGLKPGVPMPRVRLPENFVDRPDALQAVKEKLLLESGQTLVVSAIAGLGGLGKSVLATAIVLDEEVRSRFEDGILWVTLGQNPDLQSCLGDWIRELDKSRDSFSATTLESASGYLHSLLAERRMLLVVDDVWNAAHADWFRVGGVGCRVLVTTREAQISGAEVYPLALMSEGEAIDLVRWKLGKLWKAADEGEVRSFAKVLGYLPLALDLAANQVRDGLSWGELRAEFEDERRSVALEVLDSSEAWERLSEEEQRKYSLRACFNLSLKRLNSEQLRQFAWLGVLPEDVDLSGTIAEVLWDVKPIWVKRGLIDLRNRSFLTDGVATFEGVATYRVHDLMHDTARGLIEKGELGIENLEMAHGAFLERYRGRSIDGSWYGLKNDGYIHSHLTWHLEMANRIDDIHDLMEASNEYGRNFWFETCDCLGQPEIFLEDIKRGWTLAEELYSREKERSIILQCRYALITATLNSLADNLSIGIVIELVKKRFWSIEQAWACLERFKDESRITEAIQKLSPYFSKKLFNAAVRKSSSIQDETRRAGVLCALVKNENADSVMILNASKSIKNEIIRARVLRSLFKSSNLDLPKLLEAISLIQDEATHESLLGYNYSNKKNEDLENLLADLKLLNSVFGDNKTLLIDIENSILNFENNNNNDLQELFENTRLIKPEKTRTRILKLLTNIKNVNLSEIFEISESISSHTMRTEVLINLASIDNTYFSEALEATRSLQDEDKRAELLANLVSIDNTYFSEALEATRSLQDEDKRAELLANLASIDNTYFFEALEATRLMENIDKKENILISLVNIKNVDLLSLLEIARAVQDQEFYAGSLASISKIDISYFSESLKIVRLIESKHKRARILVSLAHMNTNCISEAGEAVRLIRSEYTRSELLCSLANISNKYFDEAWESIMVIHSEYHRARIVSSLTNINNDDFSKLIEFEKSIQDEYSRSRVLSSLANINDFNPLKILQSTQEIKSEFWQRRVLASLLKNNPDLIDSIENILLNQPKKIMPDKIQKIDDINEILKDNNGYLLNFSELLNSIRLIHNQSSQALPKDEGDDNSSYLSNLLETTKTIQDENYRAWILIERAKNASEQFIPAIYQSINDIIHEPIRIKAISGYLPRMPAALAYNDWKSHLHLLAHRTRADLMGDLATLYPAILHLGGEDAGRGMVGEMGRICKQWK